MRKFLFSSKLHTSQEVSEDLKFHMKKCVQILYTSQEVSVNLIC